MGREDFHLFRPSITPFLGQYNRDIAQIMQRGMAHMGILREKLASGGMGRGALCAVAADVRARSGTATLTDAELVLERLAAR
jgi:hypothetical protein